MTETIQIAILILLLGSPRTWTSFPIPVLALFSHPPLPLALGGTSTVQQSWLAVDTIVHIRNPFIRVIADDVLPCIATLAEDRASIIFIEKTDAFDGVRLFFIGRDRVGNGAVGGGRTQRSGDQIRIRGGVRDGEGGGICHSRQITPSQAKTK